jgi:hypothetical protein
MNSCARSAEAPIAAEGGLRAPAHGGDDPWRALDELMAVVEALCPVWPERPTFPEGAKFLL